MKRRLALLAFGCAALFALVRARDGRGSAPTTGAAALEALVPRSGTEKPTVAALSIAAPGRGVEWLFVRTKGRWRVREAFGAYADDEAMQELLATLLDARGVVVDPGAADDATLGARFSLTGATLVRIGLHGSRVLEAPDRDVLARIDLGARVPHASGVFARRGDEGPVLELDRSVDAWTGGLEPGELPPLVDRHLVAGSLAPGALGLRRMILEKRGGARLIVELDDADGDANADAGGDAQPHWSLSVDGARQECPPWRAGGYMGAWLRGLASGFEPATRAQELGFDAPFARARLEPDSGEPIELEIGDVEPDRRAYVWNRRTNVLMRIEGSLQPLLAPELADFLDASRANPWERFLQSQAPRARR